VPSSGTEAGCGRAEPVDGPGVVSGDEEKDVSHSQDVRRGDPLNHRAAASRPNLTIHSDGSLGSGPVCIVREQEDIDRWWVSRACYWRGRLLGDPGKPEGARETLPRPIARLKVVGNVRNDDAGRPKGVGHGGEIHGASGSSSGAAGEQQQRDEEVQTTR
jgi:hypothetical protein